MAVVAVDCQQRRARAELAGAGGQPIEREEHYRRYRRHRLAVGRWVPVRSGRKIVGMLDRSLRVGQEGVCAEDAVRAK